MIIQAFSFLARFRFQEALLTNLANRNAQALTLVELLPLTTELPCRNNKGRYGSRTYFLGKQGSVVHVPSAALSNRQADGLCSESHPLIPIIFHKLFVTRTRQCGHILLLFRSWCGGARPPVGGFRIALVEPGPLGKRFGVDRTACIVGDQLQTMDGG